MPDSAPPVGLDDLHLLPPFLVVADELHFTRAARRMYMAQPAVSRKIASLERQLGVKLFVRSPQGVRLTAAGRVLQARLIPALQAVDAAVLEAQRVADTLGE